ncbi:ATP-binding cassette domain-containing protein [Citricoccus sp. NPDC079358]|uniref:phosphonate ABC transporter ATP-binding protein n=1 Tax=Citricoccus sp. NPDC079358 TaxID=3154653 RepID=UPI00344C8894
MTDPSAEPTPAVALQDLTVSYGGRGGHESRSALDGITLRIQPGERVALVGPSGAGKSTLLGLCNGTVTPASGQVQVLGTDPARASARELRAWRSRIGSVHQQLNLVGPLRVVHNVNAGHLGSWGRGRALRSLIRPLQVGQARVALDRVGIAGHLYQRTDRLSGGQQQRVALARVLVQDPDLVLADEPVSSLDPARADEVMGLLCGVLSHDRPRRTLVVSLHDFDLAVRHCDRVVGLRQGRVVLDLPAAEVDAHARQRLYALEPDR